ncbi:hypothetical protein C478_03687 [Natrinema thermotolerans DSM 11552]|uniref:hypothetical protein n=1 Tax=Natrinema sp. H-ect1 TaxID=3242700 RepID=UPI0002B01384|nr:hypothetical protein C478_03687 [Natrinema thermotolerans DSM 11552]
MSIVTTNGRELTIDGKTIELPNQIETVLEINGLAVVLLDTTGRSPARDNVWAFDMDGSLVWKAEPVFEPSNDANTYVQIRREGSDLWASDWKGMEYKLDLQNGKQIEEKFRK